MKSTVRSLLSSATPLALGAVLLSAGIAGCGDDVGVFPGYHPSTAGVDAAMASEADNWPAENTVSTCDGSMSVNVGSYVVQANYWNKSKCPGTQCMDINQATGAFKVTQSPATCDPTGNIVATYPNVLYGCSFGNCSPASLLPMQVGDLSTVTSSWDYSASGAASDSYNVAYDIWFCPDTSCGAGGFPGGVELMIWLDYKNAHGWKNDLGTATLAGYTWEVWQMTVGSGARAWNDMSYLIKSPMVSKVTDLDLGAFFKDLVARGAIQNSWYLYAIQAGNELRNDGAPYTSNSFSVTINGVTPTTAPIATLGESPSADGGAPVAPSTLDASSN